MFEKEENAGELLGKNRNKTKHMLDIILQKPSSEKNEVEEALRISEQRSCSPWKRMVKQKLLCSSWRGAQWSIFPHCIRLHADGYTQKEPMEDWHLNSSPQQTAVQTGHPYQNYSWRTAVCGTVSTLEQGRSIRRSRWEKLLWTDSNSQSL